MKKIVCLITALMITVLSVVGCSNNGKEDNNSKGMKITMVTSVGGVTDGSFNQSAWEGLQKAQKDSIFHHQTTTFNNVIRDLLRRPAVHRLRIHNIFKLCFYKFPAVKVCGVFCNHPQALSGV